jgi:hypothetical protein
VSRPLASFLDEKLADGAVIDLPVVPHIALRERGHRVLLGAFHRRPLGECFTSFESPLAKEVNALAARLPERRAATALHALGFRNVIVHQEQNTPVPAFRELPAQFRAVSTGDPRLVDQGAVESHHVFRLESAIPVATDLALLAAGITDHVAPAVAPKPKADVEFLFRNAGPATFRHPDPIEPAPFVVRWYDGSSRVVAEERIRLLLPLAMAPDGSEIRRVALATPAPGTYRVALVPAESPELVVSSTRVDVRAE